MRLFIAALWLFSIAAPPLSARENPGKGGIYSPFGKRDPFREPVVSEAERTNASLGPLEKYSIQQFQLKAILRGFGRARALFEDPEGKTHILVEGDTIGRERGTISRVLNSEVIITEKTNNYLGVESLYEKLISLPKEKDAIQ